MARENEFHMSSDVIYKSDLRIKEGGSNLAFAFAAVDRTLLLLGDLHPMHYVVEVASVETFRAPDQRVVKGLAAVLFVLEVGVAPVGLLGVSVVGSDRVQTNCALGKQLHTV